MRGDGQLSSPIQRPGRSSYDALGGRLSCIQARTIGSSMMPVSLPFSQWSHQRTTSCRKPIAGPGTPMCGYLCPHGPISALRGTSRCSMRREVALV